MLMSKLAAALASLAASAWRCASRRDCNAGRYWWRANWQAPMLFRSVKRRDVDVEACGSTGVLGRLRLAVRFQERLQCRPILVEGQLAGADVVPICKETRC